jgi:F-type H+-transporting ATPase subunit b
MHPALVTLGSGAALIDIDSTLFIQLGIFAVFAFVATRMLFRPYLRMRDQREAGIEGARAEAANLSAEADARLADYEQTIGAARSRAQNEQRKIRAEAAAHEREVTEKARSEATRTLDQARARIAAERAAARAELEPRAADIARQVAAKLLGREVA